MMDAGAVVQNHVGIEYKTLFAGAFGNQHGRHPSYGSVRDGNRRIAHRAGALPLQLVLLYRIFSGKGKQENGHFSQRKEARIQTGCLLKSAALAGLLPKLLRLAPVFEYRGRSISGG
jgi:hypothetical protein